MLLKTHSLDLRPKSVLADPLKLKQTKIKKFVSTVPPTVEERPKKIPQRKIYPNLFKQNSAQKPTQKLRIIEKVVNEGEKEFKEKNKEELEDYYMDILNKKIFLEEVIKINRKTNPIKLNDKRMESYKEIFVEPMIQQLNKIQLQLKENLFKKKKSLKQIVIEKKTQKVFNEIPVIPKFILKQPKKQAKIVSAFSKNTLYKSNAEKSTIADEEENLMKNSQNLMRFSKINQQHKKFVIQRPSTSQLPQNMKSKRFASAFIQNSSKFNLKIKSAFQSLKEKEKQIFENLQKNKNYLTKLIVLDLEKNNFFPNQNKNFKIYEKKDQNFIEKSFQYAMYYEKKGNNFKTLNYLQKIYQSHQYKKDPKFQIFILSHMAYCEYEMKNFNGAYELTKAYLEKDKKFFGMAFFNLILIARSLQNIGLQGYYLEKFQQFVENNKEDKQNLFLY